MNLKNGSYVWKNNCLILGQHEKVGVDIPNFSNYSWRQGYNRLDKIF